MNSGCAISVAIAEGCVAQLRASSMAGEFVEAIDPVRSYADWDLPLAESNVLHVDVAAVTTEQRADLISRGQVKLTVPVDIAVRKRFGQGDQQEDTEQLLNTSIDPLVLLVQQVHLLFMPQRLTSFPTGVWQETKLLVVPLNEHLRKLRQFTGIVRVTFNAELRVVA